jgi:hypothetical protein
MADGAAAFGPSRRFGSAPFFGSERSNSGHGWGYCWFDPGANDPKQTF